MPKLFLAVDNCFASKRLTRPLEWMTVLKDMGITWVEASADNEADPLYLGPEGFRHWIDAVKDASSRTGVRVANLYSGHGTYTTLGLGHHDPDVRRRMAADWIHPMLMASKELGAGLGFFCHAFDHRTLENPDLYRATLAELTRQLTDIAAEAHRIGAGPIGVEQMYTPHQVPWTVAGARDLLAAIFESKHPFYLTLDTGHQSGQRKFLRPDETRLLQELEKPRQARDLWVGTDHAHELLLGEGPSHPPRIRAAEITKDMDRHPHLFAEPEDGDPWHWLREWGTHSPILHLQQTDGRSSGHQPFDERHNASGIIQGAPLLRTLRESFQRPTEAALPPVCTNLFLTLEVFTGTSMTTREAIRRIRDSVSYWRRFVPVDGMDLDEAVHRLGTADI